MVGFVGEQSKQTAEAALMEGFVREMGLESDLKGHTGMFQVAEHEQRQLPPHPWHRGNRSRKAGPQAGEEM